MPVTRFLLVCALVLVSCTSTVVPTSAPSVAARSLSITSTTPASVPASAKVPTSSDSPSPSASQAPVSASPSATDISGLGTLAPGDDSLAGLLTHERALAATLADAPGLAAPLIQEGDNLGAANIMWRVALSASDPVWLNKVHPTPCWTTAFDRFRAAAAANDVAFSTLGDVIYSRLQEKGAFAAASAKIQGTQSLLAASITLAASLLCPA